MPALKTYDLFISHAWTYNEEYQSVVKMLNEAPNFYWRNCSTTATIEADLDGQIRPASAVLILSGMYENHREWVQAEIELAQAYQKPIIGVIPWGAERVPELVQNAATAVVRWHSESIVSTIRAHAL